MKVTALSLAQRFLGLQEVEGHTANPQILAMLQLDARWPQGDEIAWCSAFVNYVAWLLGLQRSKSLAARSWLAVGTPVAQEDAVPGFDVVILKRGGGNQPGPEVLDAQGHVGFFAGREPGAVRVLGGNQGDAVSEEAFPASRILGIRRLA